MAVFQRKIYRKLSLSQLGMTLIEVLIALSIISIALTAIIKSVSQNIRATTYLQDKTIAMWVAKEVINEVKVGVMRIDNHDTLKSSTRMLGKNWYWQVSQHETQNKQIKKLDVTIFAKEDSEDVLLRMESYVHASE